MVPITTLPHYIKTLLRVTALRATHLTMAGLSCARPLASRRASLAPRHATVAPPHSQSVSPRRLAVSASAPGPGGDAESRPDVAPPMALTRRAAALAGFALVASAAFNPAATAIPVAPLGKPGVYSTEAKALGLSDWALAHGASYESLSSPLECHLSSLAPADAGIAVLSMDLRVRQALINPAGCVGSDATRVRLPCRAPRSPLYRLRAADSHPTQAVDDALGGECAV